MGCLLKLVCFSFYNVTTTIEESAAEAMFYGPLPVCPYSINIFFTSCRGGISVKLGTNIHRMSGHCWQGCQGQRAKVKAMARVETEYTLTVQRSGWVV